MAQDMGFNSLNLAEIKRELLFYRDEQVKIDEASQALVRKRRELSVIIMTLEKLLREKELHEEENNIHVMKKYKSVCIEICFIFIIIIILNS